MTPNIPPPGVSPQEPQWHNPTQSRSSKRRGASFFVAIFLGILLLVSAALNLLLLVISVSSMASVGLGGDASDEGGAGYVVTRTSGEADAECKVLRIPIRGVIAEEGNSVLGAGGGMVSQVRLALKFAKNDEKVRGILLEIDSPGGGVTDSDAIYQMLMKFRAERADVKVIALFGDIAASGGYYVAAAAERIMARRTTITGSIGVIMSSWNFAEAAKKFGIEQIAIKSDRTPLKDMLSQTRAMTEAEKVMLTSIVDDFYDQFVSIVDDGRPNLDRSQVLALATGGVYTAKQALTNGLIDEIGDATTAEALFRKELGSVQFIERHRQPSLRDLLFGVHAPVVPTFAEAAARLFSASTGPRFLYYWEGAR
jgi:protease-4